MLVDHGAIRTVYPNFYSVAEQVYRSGQPSPFQVRQAANIGIRTIVNLRGVSPKGYYHLEEEACEDAGLNLVSFQVRSRALPSRQKLHDAKKLFEELEYPVLFHCKSGADRAGFFSALYRWLHLGQSAEHALAQLNWRFGHLRHSKAGVLDAFYEAYIARRNATGQDAWAWIDNEYDPTAIKQEFLSGTPDRTPSDDILKFG